MSFLHNRLALCLEACVQEARATSLMRSSINQFRNATALPSSSHTRHRRRGYATESTSLPRSILLRSPAPPSPTTQAQHPESASESASDIETYLHEFHRHIRRDDSLSKECASIPQLYKQLGNHAARVLNDELAFEDTPSDSRRLSTSNRVDKWQDSCELASRRISGRLVQEAEEDGLVLVSHVIASDPPITSWSLGFVIRTLQETTYIVTCSHTLESAAHSQRSIGSADSSTICITRSGLILPINGIASALPLHDLVVYTVSDLAMPRRQESDNAASSASSQLRSVPVALHPPQVGDKQQLFLIGNEEWRSCRVVGYKDPRGNDVEPGTYDDLNSLNIDILPTPGSSGGPLVSTAGSVTALIRGSRMAFGDVRSVGFATPAEKLFEMFQLPGFGKKQKGPSGAAFVYHY